MSLYKEKCPSLNQISFFVLVFTLTCCAPKQEKKTSSVASDSIQVENLRSTPLNKDSTTQRVQSLTHRTYTPSTYDVASVNLETHKQSLKELADSSVFLAIHGELIPSLNPNHQRFFSSMSQFQVLNSTPGDLFQNGNEDNAFVVYDKKHSRISFLIYDESKDIYSELYRDIRVTNGLEDAKCDYGAYGTLDYQFANELINQRDYLIKNPKSHLEYTRCKIVDISNDEDIVMDRGCFAAGVSANNKIKCLCIPTSSVYNNWECLIYNTDRNDFTIFYGQAFAD
jgi:hypothetical protein